MDGKVRDRLQAPGDASADRGEALASELTGLGTPTLFVQCDIAEPSTPEAIVEACDQKFGTVHGVVNVAAATSRATLFTDTPEHFAGFIKSEIVKWAKAVRDSGAKVD